MLLASCRRLKDLRYLRRSAEPGCNAIELNWRSCPIIEVNQLLLLQCGSFGIWSMQT
jgi:hypothetical protein